MRLEQWIDEQVAEMLGKGTPTSKRAVLEALAQRAGVSYMTLVPVAKGSRLAIYLKARAVSEATGWGVTIPELCERVVTPEVSVQFRKDEP
jgi:hypothetical protein